MRPRGLRRLGQSQNAATVFLTAVSLAAVAIEGFSGSASTFLASFSCLASRPTSPSAHRVVSSSTFSPAAPTWQPRNTGRGLRVDMRAESESPVVSEGYLAKVLYNKKGKAVKYLVQLGDGRKATLKFDTMDAEQVKLARLLRRGDNLTDLYVEDRGRRGTLTAEPYIPSLERVVSGRDLKTAKRMQFEEFIETLNGKPVAGRLVKISWTNGRPNYWFNVGCERDALLNFYESGEIRSLTAKLKPRDRITKMHVSFDRARQTLSVVPDLDAFRSTVKGRTSLFDSQKPGAESA